MSSLGFAKVRVRLLQLDANPTEDVRPEQDQSAVLRDENSYGLFSATAHRHRTLRPLGIATSAQISIRGSVSRMYSKIPSSYSCR